VNIFKNKIVCLFSIVTLCIGFCILLRLCYQSAAGIWGMEVWQAAALVNGALVSFFLMSSSKTMYGWLWSLLPLLCGTAVLLLPTTHLVQKVLVFCICVPLIEEALFRGGISQKLRFYLGHRAGFAFSLVVFCMCHNQFNGFSTVHIVEFVAFFGLGVFLLGVVLETVWQKWKSMYLQVVVHGLANGAAVITTLLPGTWKAWLSPLLLQL
jgi:membrane protease YdiL (CAAX protease family)